MMQPTRVIVENLPLNHWYNDWIPIIIAIISLIVAIVSLYWTKRQYVRSTRPFVWAVNYANKINHAPLPYMLSFKVKNTPAKIIQLQFEILDKTKNLFSDGFKNLVRFPDDSSEWTYELGKNDFEKIMNRPDADKKNLIRKISIKYSSLDGGKTYQFRIEQSFEPLNNQWKDIYEFAD